MPAANLAMLKPDRILKELSELWTTMGKPVAGEVPSEGGVLRACSMTLIAIVDDSEDSLASPGTTSLGETLALLMRDHPSRAIVIRLTKDPDHLDCRVFAQCWMPFGNHRQICCEQVEITVSPNRLEDIPPIVGPLAVPDLPRMVWWRTSALSDASVMAHLLDLGDRIIIDSDRTGAPSLRDLRVLLDQGHLVGDLAWTRITELRELLAQLLETHRPADIKSMQIDYCGQEPGSEAKYLAGWLEDALPDLKVELKHVAEKGGVREVRIEPGIQVTLGGSCANFQLGQLHERASFHSGSDYELLNEELRITVHDRVFERVLRKIT